MRPIDADKIPYTDLNSDMPQSKVRVYVAFKESIDKLPTIEKDADPKAVQKVLFSGSHLDVMTKAEVNRNCKKIIQIVPVAPNEYIVEVEDER